MDDCGSSASFRSRHPAQRREAGRPNARSKRLCGGRGVTGPRKTATCGEAVPGRHFLLPLGSKAHRIAWLVKVRRVLRPLIRLAHRAVVGDRRAQPVRRGLAIPRRRRDAARRATTAIVAAAAITHRAVATAGHRGRGGRRGQTEESGDPAHRRCVLPEHLLIREREQWLVGSVGEHARGKAT